jgi:hypothetical protein
MEIVMKKLILALSLLAVIGTASAHGPHGIGGWRGGYYGGGCGGCWIAPAVIGGVIGYELTRPSTIYVEPQPVVIQQSQPVVQAPPVGYHWQQMVDPQTGITKIVAVPN